jgi:hypothetical protein
VDILKQSYAVERSLKAFESALLEGHLAWARRSLPEQLRDHSPQAPEQGIHALRLHRRDVAQPRWRLAGADLAEAS